MEDYKTSIVPGEEIERRLYALQGELRRLCLCGCLIMDKVNLYYYSGTMQNGTLFIPETGEPLFFIRRSLERGREESPLKCTQKLKRFKDIPEAIAGRDISQLGIDETTTPLALFSKFRESFPCTTFEDISFSLSALRSVKSPYEISLIREAGKRHKLLYDAIPQFIHEGMTEWELGSGILNEMLRLGFMGVLRLSGINQEAFVGNICFGDSANTPCAFEGPGGLAGLSAAFPLLGGNRRLKKGDLIFIDTGFGYNGYYTDKTRILSLGKPRAEVIDAHNTCLAIQEEIRRLLRPGISPSEIFERIYNGFLTPDFAQHFMGYNGNQVRFLGHGIGLTIDEFPAIASKVNYPLKEGMVIAVEPKKGLENIGMAGIENTFLVAPEGGERLTPGADDILVI